MSPAASLPKPFILFVEDDAPLREHLASALSDEFDIHPVGTGEEALTLVLKQRPDLIVTDMVLPEIDGVELIRLLRNTPSTASIPVLMASVGTADEVRDGYVVGADAYLAKPYTERELRMRMRSMLKNARLRVEAARHEVLLEAERRVLEERAALLENMTEAFYALDREWRFTYLNRRALDYFGLPREALLGQVFWDVFPQLKNTIAQRESERALRDQTTVQVEFQSAVSGRWLEVHAYPHQQGLAVHFRDISDRKRADELLQESERKLRLMSDALPALVSYIDRNYRYQLCNRRYEEWFGVTREQIVGRTMREVLGDAAFERLKPFADRAIAGEEVSLETRIAYRTGGTREVQINYIPERDDAGIVRGYYALVQDISERKGVELRLRESEARFRSMADNAPVMVWVTEADGQCSYLSQSWYEFTGQTPATGLGHGWLQAVHPDDMPHTERAFVDASEGRKPFRLEYRLRRADGSYVSAIDAASPRFDDAGAFLGFIGSVIDIQDRREMEEKLRSLNEQLEQRVTDVLAERKLFADLVEGTHAFVQVVDLNYRWLAINPASASEFERIYGIRPKVGDSMLALLRDRPEHLAAVKAVWARALAGEEFIEVAVFGDRMHERRYYEMRFNSLRDRAGRLVGAYQFTYDVSQRMRDEARFAEAQEALRQSQKMETLGQLTGGVAHDFNNLLTPIVGALDMLWRKYQGDPRTERLTSGALQAADRAKILIQRLLAFARRQHLESRAVDIRQLLDGVRDLLARTLGPQVELSIQVEEDVPPVHVDSNQLELALLNLAVNARDAMPRGGQLDIRVSEDEISSSRRMQAGRYVRICVRDDGLGMDAQTLERAIEPFFTTKGIGQGTGLGLSMVHGLAAQSGGDFVLESAPDRGTTAILWIPVAAEAPLAEVEDAPSLTSGPATATVLLVDDEPLVRSGTSAMLIDGGYDVVEASSADEALQLIRDGLQVDALVTDFAMPGRTGAQLARELRALTPQLPVLMITGFASLTEAEADGLPRLAKPFRQTELLSSVAEVMAAGSVR